MITDKCDACQLSNLSINDWKGHIRSNLHWENAKKRYSPLTVTLNEMWGNRIGRYRIKNPDDSNLCFEDFFKNPEVKSDIEEILNNYLLIHKIISFQLRVYALYGTLSTETIQPNEEKSENQTGANSNENQMDTTTSECQVLDENLINNLNINQINCLYNQIANGRMCLDDDDDDDDDNDNNLLPNDLLDNLDFNHFNNFSNGIWKGEISLNELEAEETDEETVSATCDKIQDGGGQQLQTEIKDFASSYKHLNNKSEIALCLESAFSKICKQADEFQGKGSGWTLCKILWFDLNINKVEHFLGRAYIKLPPSIETKKACVNPKNTDVFCFKHCVYAFCKNNELFNEIEDIKKSKMDINIKKKLIKRIENAKMKLNKLPVIQERQLDYKYKIKWTKKNNDELQFPLQVDNIKYFEQNNPTFSINVFVLDENEKLAGPIYHTSMKKVHHINLILIDDGESEFHYVWIKNMSRMVSRQITNNEHRLFICDGCLISFTSSEKLHHHVSLGDCLKTVSKFPADAFLTYTKFHNEIETPFVVYADAECLLEPTVGVQNGNETQSCKFKLFYVFKN